MDDAGALSAQCTPLAPLLGFFVGLVPINYNDPTGHDPWWVQDRELSYVRTADTRYLTAAYYDGSLSNAINWPSSPPGDIGHTSVDLTPILADALTAIGTENLPISVDYDRDGNPQIDFDPEGLQKMVVLPLSACASGVEGVCGISVGSAGNVYGGGARASADVFANQDGQFAIFLSPGGGGYTPLPGPVGRVTATGIPNATLADLDGPSGQFGGSGAVGPWGGYAEAWFGKADDGTRLHGQTYGYAYSPPTVMSMEVHMTMTYSVKLYPR